MDMSTSKSFFHNLSLRELTGFRVRKRACCGETASDYSEIGAVAVQHNGDETPPLALSFCKTSKKSHILAVSDEDGYVSLFDTRRKNTEKSIIRDWVAHENAIFDICWIKDDTNLVTASGDQTIKIWDVQEKKCSGVLMGHTGSVKSLCLHPTDSDIIISGSRDGSFAIWDLRCKVTPKSGGEETCINSTAMVQKAHLSPQAKRARRGKAASMSITSVLCLKDGVSIATAGAVDSKVKFWDTRNLKSQVTQACPFPNSSPEKAGRLHGISSLSQDSNGVFLTASCMDNRIYLYNVLRLEKGPLQSFSGCRIESFYVKSAISPDAAHILSGSSDGNAYVWQVNKPQMYPVQLKSHDGEVTAVDWCQSEVGKLATSSDDFTVRIWNIENTFHSNTKSPSSVRRRVMAMTSADCRQLLTSEEQIDTTKGSGRLQSSDEPSESDHTHSHNPITMPAIRTPEAQKKRFAASLDSTEIFEKTPEAEMKSPSSVLNPPSSLKRKTIRDYFLAA